MIENANRPLAIFSIMSTFLLGGCSATGVLNAVTTSSNYTLNADVAYGNQPRQKLDIYTPTSVARPPTGWPVVVFFYGGSWNTGGRTQYQFLGEALAARGVLTLVADYRLYPEVRYPDFLIDSAQALAYGFNNAARLGGDPRRVFVMGHSSGGYNAAMLALDARWLDRSGRAVRFLFNHQPRREVSLLPPKLFGELAAHWVHAARCAAQLSRRSGARYAGQSAAQHPAARSEFAGHRYAGYVEALPSRKPHDTDRCICLAVALDRRWSGVIGESPYRQCNLAKCKMCGSSPTCSRHNPWKGKT